MITLKRNEVLIKETALINYQDAFKNTHSLVIPDFFCSSLQELMNLYLSQAEFFVDSHAGTENNLIAKEYTVTRESIINNLLSFYLNKPEVIETVKKITQCENIKSFFGRIYKFEDDENSFDSWHNDISKKEHRIVGISLNLSSSPYTGGEFTIRNKKTHKIYRKVKHDNWGGVHFFRIHPDLEHKVDKVTGINPRIAYAGWFIDQISEDSPYHTLDK